MRVTVNGSQILDEDGVAVDADADGVAGGIGRIEFDTLSLTVVPGTSVCGRVFASELVPGGAGESVNVPLAGVGSPAFIAPDEGITVPFGSYGGGAVVLSSPTPLLLDNTNFRAADAGTAPIENSAPARLGEAKLRGLGAGW